MEFGGIASPIQQQVLLSEKKSFRNDWCQTKCKAIINNTHDWTCIDVIRVAMVILRFQGDPGMIICNEDALFICLCFNTFGSLHSNDTLLKNNTGDYESKRMCSFTGLSSDTQTHTDPNLWVFQGNKTKNILS